MTDETLAGAVAPPDMTAAAAPSADSSDVRPSPGVEKIDRAVRRLLVSAERILIWTVGITLIALAVLNLASTIGILIVDIRSGNPSRAIVIGIDDVFLTVILLELLHTVLSTDNIWTQLQEFLVVGITSAVRHGLTLAVQGGDPTQVVIQLGINSLGALALIVALWLVHTSIHAPHPT